MQEVNLPKQGGFVVVKKRIEATDSDVAGFNYPSLYVHLARPDSSGNYTYDALQIPYPLDIGEWYPVKSIGYPRKSWTTYQGIPWFTLGLLRSRRAWCKSKIETLVSNALNNPQYEQYETRRIGTTTITLKSTMCNGKLYWVETELEAKRLSAELQGRILTLPEAHNERWIDL